MGGLLAEGEHDHLSRERREVDAAKIAALRAAKALG
jgi:hypothetical protein